MDPEAYERPAQKRDDWYTPEGGGEANVKPEPGRRPRKKSLAHICQFPMPSMDGSYPRSVSDPNVEVGRDGVARNGTVAVVGFHGDPGPDMPQVVHPSIWMTLVDNEDDRGRCPGE